MLYHSTRDKKLTAKASEAILRGIAPDGGLYVPDEIPKLDRSFTQLAKLDYPHLAYEVMKLFIDDFTPAELKAAVNSAYNTKNFDHEDITCLVEAGDAYYLELFHGRTIAFKDMALSILPYLMKTAAKKNDVHEEIVILTATSGDTGKAALAGFDSVEGTSIVVFYPKDGVSPVQERQMVTQAGANTHVIGIRGNFDDAQCEVKRAFTDAELNKEMKKAGYVFSSANSINIGRLVPQIAYYVYAYTRLMPKEINFVVPTGNFGNILAAYYAYRMGVPIHKLICASNENKVLYDFFETGVYDRNRDFILTSSPSMDILISSNLERLVAELAGDKTGKLMKELAETGKYELPQNAKKAEALQLFEGEFATEPEMAARIKELYEAEGYILDPHTAVASAAYEKYRARTGDETTTVIASTASPYKFTRAVLTAIDKKKYAGMKDFDLFAELEKLSGVKLPKAITDIMTAPVKHDTVCVRDKLIEEIEKIYLK
ncbi:MAG: threonine synthase [Lachnospiraceae bacterium]|nr:threonine synthase [Lachnospiraceae bacterium]